MILRSLIISTSFLHIFFIFAARRQCLSASNKRSLLSSIFRFRYYSILYVQSKAFCRFLALFVNLKKHSFWALCNLYNSLFPSFLSLYTFYLHYFFNVYFPLSQFSVKCIHSAIRQYYRSKFSSIMLFNYS